MFISKNNTKLLNKKLELALYFLLIFTCLSCGQSSPPLPQKYLLEFSNDFTSNNNDSCWINASQIKEVNHLMVNYTNAEKPWGIGIRKAINDLFTDKPLLLHLECEFMFIGKNTKAIFAAAIKNKDSLLSWQSIEVIRQNTQENTWCLLKDSIPIPVNFDPKALAELVLWQTSNEGEVYIKNIKIGVSEYKTRSFIKGSLTHSETFFRSKLNPEFTYAILMETNSDTILIDKFSVNNHNDTMINYSCARSPYEINLMEVVRPNKINNNSNLFYKLSIKSHQNKPKEINRFALVMKYEQKLKQLNADRGLILNTFPLKEYWIGKNGKIVLEDKEKEFELITNKSVSSLQILPDEKLLIINFDYLMDHPLLHFPILKKNEGKFTDVSANKILPEQVKEHHFEINVVLPSTVLPSLGRLPKGFSSAFLFTEHADFTDLRTHKAIYYGSELINEPKNASGGFIKYNIPVTKSVFYNNDRNTLNSESPEKTDFKTPLCNIQTTKGYLEFLKNIKDYGSEICLHTPEYYTSNKKSIEDAFEFMANNFGSKTWIDHGYDNDPISNQEDIVRFGLDTTSPFSILKYLNKYKVNYLWNCYNEDVSDYYQPNFSNCIQKPYPGLTMSVPDPLYWRHQNSNNCLHWSTNFFIKPMGDKQYFTYFFNDKNLEDLVSYKGITITHIYPAWVNSENHCWRYDDKGRCVAKEEFNDFLKRLSNFREKGRIMICTIPELLDYQLLLENIKLYSLGKNSFVLENNNSCSVKALTLYLNKKFNLICSDVKTKYNKLRLEGNENVYSIDLNPSSKTIFYSEKNQE